MLVLDLERLEDSFSVEASTPHGGGVLEHALVTLALDVVLRDRSAGAIMLHWEALGFLWWFQPVRQQSRRFAKGRMLRCPPIDLPAGMTRKWGNDVAALTAHVHARTYCKGRCVPVLRFEEVVIAPTTSLSFNRIGKLPMLRDEVGEGIVAVMARIDIESDDARSGAHSDSYVSPRILSPPSVDLLGLSSSFLETVLGQGVLARR